MLKLRNVKKILSDLKIERKGWGRGFNANTRYHLKNFPKAKWLIGMNDERIKRIYADHRQLKKQKTIKHWKYSDDYNKILLNESNFDIK